MVILLLLPSPPKWLTIELGCTQSQCSSWYLKRGGKAKVVVSNFVQTTSSKDLNLLEGTAQSFCNLVERCDTWEDCTESSPEDRESAGARGEEGGTTGADAALEGEALILMQ